MGGFRQVPAAMIVERLDAPHACEFRLLPNRSLTRRGTRLWLGAIGFTMFAVAGLSASQGNVFAPVFAMAQLALILASFAQVARRQEREERIALAGDELLIEQRDVSGAVQSVRFHPYWVRLERGGRRGTRLWLRSHGRRLEVGALLGPDERDELGNRLKRALAAWRAGSGAGVSIDS